MGKKKADQKTGKEILTFTVAECGEYHSLGKYYYNSIQISLHYYSEMV